MPKGVRKEQNSKLEKELLKTAKESGVPYPELIDLIKAKNENQ